jgi:hypothetical protein
MRRRDNSPSAIAASKAIKPQFLLDEHMTNPQELVEQREIIRAKKVRHNRDKRWRSNPDFWPNWTTQSVNRD